MEWFYVYLVCAFFSTTMAIVAERPAWKTDGAEQICKQRCEKYHKSPYQGLSFRANQTSGLLVISNETAPVAVVLDINNDLILLWNGTTGLNILIDYKNKRAIVITPEANSIAWKKGLHSDPDGDFLRVTPSLKIYLKIQGGRVYKLSDLPKSILDIIKIIFEYLLGGRQVRGRDGLDGNIELSKIVIRVLNGPLRGILPFLNRKRIRGNGDRWPGTLIALGRIADNDFFNPPSD